MKLRPVEVVHGVAASVVAIARICVSFRPLIVAVLAAAYAIWRTGLSWTPDFDVFWVAAAHHSGPVYDSAYLTALQSGPGERPFPYPPTFLLMILPLAFLPMKAAYVVWVTISSITLVEVGAKLSRLSWVVLLCPLATIAGLMGQTTFFTAALIYGAFVVQSQIVAGCLLGVAACIKPQVMILIPLIWILERRWTAIWSMLGTAAALCLSATLAFGPSKWLDWLSALPHFIALNNKMDVPRLGLPLPLNLVAGLAAVALVVRAVRDHNRPRALFAAIAGALLLSPHSPRYEAVDTFIPAMAAVGLSWQIAPVIVLLMFPPGAAAFAVTALLIGIPNRLSLPAKAEAPTGSPSTGSSAVSS